MLLVAPIDADDEYLVNVSGSIAMAHRWPEKLSAEPCAHALLARSEKDQVPIHTPGHLAANTIWVTA
jgi:hypothetical protein